MSRRETERMGRHRNNVKVHKDLIERTLDIFERVAGADWHHALLSRKSPDCVTVNGRFGVLSKQT